MSRRKTVVQRVEDFRAKNPEPVGFTLEEMNEVVELGSQFDVVRTAFYFGYMKGIKARKGGGK